MDFNGLFEISASGMNVERMRMELIAMNIANANTTRPGKLGAYKPMRLISQPKYAVDFEQILNGVSPAGVEVAEVAEANVKDRVVYQPGHPDANDKGYVHYPGINPVSEMIDLTRVTRSYEANVKALNAAKTMALKALEIGR